MRLRGLALALLAALALASCRNSIDVEPPVRADTPPEFASASSTIRMPVAISLNQLQARLEQRIPQRLWSIDEQKNDCVPKQRVLGIAVTPNISCRIVGEVNRGQIAVSGSGRELLIRLPVNASLRAEDIGAIFRQETATGTAVATLHARISMSADWQPHADIQVSYEWSEEPGIDFLGGRIRFTGTADSKLENLVTQIEEELERAFAGIRFRPLVERAWQKGFAVVSVNRENPPTWLRITPQALDMDGYVFEGRDMLVEVALQARTETLIGDRPEPEAPTPLPDRAGNIEGESLQLMVRVLADYGELEPVVLRALRRAAERGISIPQVGAVSVEFESVEIYGTDKGRIAVGVVAKVTPEEGFASIYGSAQGEIWLTGTPFNEPDSAVISIHDLAIHGDTDSNTVNLLTLLFFDEGVRAAIEAALVGDFSREYDSVIEDAREALSDLQAGDLHLSVTLDEIRHGAIQASGQGLFLPVTASGSGRLTVNLQ